MKKVTVSLPQGEWGTLKTKYPRNSDKVKFTEFTGTSKNFDTDVSGVITKRLGGLNYNASSLSSAPADMYEAIFTNGTHHLLTMNSGTLSYSAGGGIMNTVTSGYSSNGNMEFALYQNRIYFGNGIDNPQSYDITASYGGVSYTAPKTKQMGAITPTAPSAALVTTGTGNVPAGAHTYKVTYLYYDSEESNGSSASSVVTADGTHKQVTVTIPVGGYGVTARKVYRDDNDGNWLLLGTVSDNTTTSYTDNSATGTTPIPTDNGLPPNFSKIVQHLDRLWVAGVSSSTSTLYYSQAGMPDLFSATGYILCNPRDPIVGLAVYNNRVLVFNRNSMGQITGRDSNSFAYAEIPSSIGCVDNRSIQIRTAQGVPTIMWLSDKGFYQFNGSSIDYISDAIEDQVNLNIQQASQVKGKNVQDTQADFSAGTSTAGISLTVGGVITQANPKRSYQVEADYTPGTQVNVALHGTGNVMKVPTAASYVLSDGSFNTCSLSGSSIVLSTTSDFTGESHLFNLVSGDATDATKSSPYVFANSITPTRSGTITSVTVRTQTVQSGTSINLYVYSNSSATPAATLFSSSAIPLTADGAEHDYTASCSVSVTGGDTYWIGFGTASSSAHPVAAYGQTSASFSGGQTSKTYNGSSWSQTVFGSTLIKQLSMAYAVTSSPIAGSGTWTSATYDSQSDTSAPTGLTQTASYPATTSAVSYVEGSNDASVWDVSISNSNVNGSVSVSASNRRYWRVRCVLSTTDNRNTPSVNAPTLTFPITATWTSTAIDHTTDITALNSLTYDSSVPAGTSVTLTVATSADNVTYSSFVAVGSATPARYTKVRATITSTSDNVTTATVSNIVLKWTVVSTQTSSAIDTSNTPVGWELFQSTYGTSGTVAFWVRTASTSGGLSGASWTSVTNGTYITASVNRWIQWKTTITSTADNVATVDSVTINWFISQTNSIRVASLFYNRSYYLAAAEYGNTTNNIVFKLDISNAWRVYRGVNIGTMSFFFNEPYYGSAASGQLVKWLTGSSDQGSAIALDVQTAAVNYDDLEHSKILRKVRIVGKNTGATYTPQYSTDNGLTWHSMVNTATGLTTFTVGTDSGLFDVRVVPVFAADNATGITHIFRLTNNDTFACEVHAVKFEAWIRQGEL